MPNAMKKFLTAGILTTIVLTGTVFPVWISSVQAKNETSHIVETFDIDENPNPNITDESWRLKDGNLRIADPSAIGGIPTVTSTQALLSFDLKMNTSADGTFAADDVNTNGHYDNDDNPNGWDSVIGGTSNFPETAACRGIFLTISKVKDPSKPITDDNLENIDTDEFDVPLPPPGKIIPFYAEKYKGDKSVEKYKFSSLQLSCLTNVQQIFATNSRANIGLYFWGMKDSTGANNFFKKVSWKDVHIPITNLEPNTKYYVHVEIKEDDVDTSTMLIIPGLIGKTIVGPHRAISNGVVIQTLSEDPTGAIDLSGSGTTDEVVNDADTTRIEDGLMDCSFELFNSSTNTDTIGKCIAKIYYRWMTGIGGVILLVSSNIFDAFLAVSIGSSIYDTDKAQFVYQGWRISRDIANIFFIFVLLFTAITTILNLGSANYKKVVTQVILIAIFINFSMFMCRVIIDTGNILARVFYNQISLTGETDEGFTKGDVKEKDVSSGLANGINPQKLFLNTRDKDTVDGTSATEMFVLGTIIFLLLVAIAWVLFMSAAFFVGRIGVLWMSMIFAPLAFVSTLMPSLGKKFGQIGWSSWFSSLMTASFNASIFMFFIYLILLLSTGLKTIMPMIEASDGVIEKITVVALPLMIIMGLLMQAKNVAKEMAGQFGEMADGAFKGVIGLGAMAVTGGAAIVGRSTVGAISNKLANPDSKFGNKMRDIAASGKFGSGIARLGVKATEAGKKGSFDIRSTGIGNTLSKATGVDMNIGAKIPLVKSLASSFSTENTAGGMEGKINRQAEKDRKTGEMLGFDKPKHDQLEKDIDDREDAISKQEDTLEFLRNKAKEAQAVGGTGNATYTDPTTGATVTRSAAVIQAEVTQATTDLRKLKKGTTEKWTNADVTAGATKLDGKPVTAADVDKPKIVTVDDMGFESMKKAKDNMKIARAKEYLNDRIIKSGKKVHTAETRDAFGNVKKFAHAGPDNDTKRSWLNLAKDFGVGIAAGIPTGAIVGSIIPGIGTVTGAIVGAGFGLAKAIRTLGEDTLGGLRYDVAHLASDTSHKIHIAKSDYKSPTSEFTNLFKGLGGGDDHGHKETSNLHVDGHGGGNKDSH